jgi:hypothetical protein
MFHVKFVHYKLEKRQLATRPCLLFNLPHMEYVGSIGLVTGKMKIFYCWFLRFSTFYGKKHDLSDKKIPSVTRRCRCRRSLFFPHLEPPPYKLEFWNFGSSSILGQIDVPHTQNF